MTVRLHAYSGKFWWQRPRAGKGFLSDSCFRGSWDLGEAEGATHSLGTSGGSFHLFDLDALLPASVSFFLLGTRLRFPNERRGGGRRSGRGGARVTERSRCKGATLAGEERRLAA